MFQSNTPKIDTAYNSMMTPFQLRERLDKEIKFDFDDILLQTESITEIDSRYSDIKLKGRLPIITAPMDTVVDSNNYHLFHQQNINVCLPRGEFPDPDDIEETFISVSLDSFEQLLDKSSNGETGLEIYPRICIDVANGHMKRMHDLLRRKKNMPSLRHVEVMAGNVGSVDGFRQLSLSGADYVRTGIGFGGGCLTAQQTGVAYAMGSLIYECRIAKDSEDLSADIVADGGMKDYADIIKALALGADMVMLGSIFNKALESCGPTFRENVKHSSWTEPGEEINQYEPKVAELLRSGINFYKKFRGMSTKEVQEKWGKQDIRTSEGVVKMNKVEYTLQGWTTNFEHYLRSAMSYCNAKNYQEFIGQPKFTLISENSLRRFRK